MFLENLDDQLTSFSFHCEALAPSILTFTITHITFFLHATCHSILSPASISRAPIKICLHAHRYLSTVKRNRPLINRPFKKWRSVVRSITRLAARDTLVYTQRRTHAKEEELALDAMFFINCPVPPVVYRSKDKVKQRRDRPRGKVSDSLSDPKVRATEKRPGRKSPCLQN